MKPTETKISVARIALVVAAAFMLAGAPGALWAIDDDRAERLDRKVKVMERVLELDPAYNHGGAHLFLLVYFGSRPPMMGGSQDKALVHYQQLKTITGDHYLLPDLFYGRFCLYQQQDREGFVDMMQRIIDHPASENEVSLYNAIAGRRAVAYLAAVDTLFE